MHWSELQTKEFFNPSVPNILYHYTNLDGLKGIVESQSLHLSKIRHMNDESELHYGFEIFKTRIEKIKEQIVSNYEIKFLDRLNKQLDSFINTNICVGSFSKDHDSLSQWRAYGDDGGGVAIGFRSEYLENISTNPEINLWKCIYSPKLKRKIIDEIISTVREKFLKLYDKFHNDKEFDQLVSDLVAEFNYTFLQISPILKNQNFSVEEEWRLITNSISYKNSNYHAQVSTERVKEYFSIDFNQIDSKKYEVIKEVVVGPTTDSSLVADAIGVLLEDKDYNHKNIRNSQIPYKSSCYNQPLDYSYQKTAYFGGIIRQLDPPVRAS